MYLMGYVDDDSEDDIKEAVMAAYLTANEHLGLTEDDLEVKIVEYDNEYEDEEG